MNIEGLKDNTLYHYTSYSAFQNMINLNELWLTHYAQMADTEEIKFGLDLVEKLAKKRFSSIKDPLISSIFDSKHNSALMPQYIMSFCHNYQNEHLWEYYAIKSTGLVIGFDAEFVVKNYVIPPVYLSPVSPFPVDYEIDVFINSITEKIEKIELPTFFVMRKGGINTAEDLRNVPNYIKARNTISECWARSMMLKNPEFRMEEEWRFIHSPINYPLKISSLKGRSRAILSLAKLPIKKIILGKNFKISQTVLNKFLSDHDYSSIIVMQNEQELIS